MCAVIIFQNNIIIQIKLFAEGISGSQQALNLQAGDIVDQMLYMRAIIRAGVGNAAVLGVSAPNAAVDLFLLGKQIEEAVLDVVGVDCNDLANIAAGNHLLHYLAHYIAGVAVVHCKDQILFLGNSRQFFRFFHSEGHGLFAHYIDAMLQKSLGCRVMHEVRRADRNKVDLTCFSLCHLFRIIVHTGLIHMICFCALVVQLIDCGKAAAYQLCTGIQTQSFTVTFTN